MNNILKIILTPEGEKKLFNYYVKISRMSMYFGTNYMANPMEVLKSKRNNDGSYYFTIEEILDIFFCDNKYIEEITQYKPKIKSFNHKKQQNCWQESNKTI